MNKKKLAAAMAAVMTCIKTVEEASILPVPETCTSVQPVAAPQPNTWGISGRQAHMQANSMMQMRMFK